MKRNHTKCPSSIEDDWTSEKAGFLRHLMWYFSRLGEAERTQQFLTYNLRFTNYDLNPKSQISDFLNDGFALFNPSYLTASGGSMKCALKIIDSNQKTRKERYKKLTEYVVGINQKRGAPRIVLKIWYDNSFSKATARAAKWRHRMTALTSATQKVSVTRIPPILSANWSEGVNFGSPLKTNVRMPPVSAAKMVSVAKRTFP